MRLHLRRIRTEKSRAGVAIQAITVALAVVLLVMPACVQPRRSFTPDVDSATLSDTVFLHYLARTPMVTVDEGARSVLLLVDSEDERSTATSRTNELLRRGAIKVAWGLDPNQVLDVGTLAHMLRVLCDVPAGLNDRIGDVTGLGDRRAALRTCHRAGLLPYSVPHAPVTGGALLTALVRAETYLDVSSAETVP